jgi:hypothetical protein
MDPTFLAQVLIRSENGHLAAPGWRRGESSRARRELSWKATTGFEDLVALMVDAAPA